MTPRAKLLVFVCFVFSILTMLSLPSSVDAAWYNSTYQEYLDILKQADTTGEVQQEGYVSGFGNTNINYINAITLGTPDPQSVFYYKNSAIGYAQQSIAFLYQAKPANTMAFIQDVGHTLGFMPKPAYAQGAGFTGLRPILELWKAFRNIAYLLLSFVLVIIGFMIMFRRKIDPKTVVTIQNSLPRIILTLILITFSYAIAALLIDFMYVLIALGAQVVASSGIQGLPPAAEIQNTYIHSDLGTLLSGTFKPLSFVTSKAPGLAGDIQQKLEAGRGYVGGIPVLNWISNPTIDVAKTIVGITGFSLGGGWGFVTDAASGQNIVESIVEGAFEFLSPIWIVIIAVILFFGFIRLFFVLLSAYINVIIAVLMGPLQLLLEAIPGTGGFASWINNLIANLIVFPLTAIILMIGGAISQNIDNDIDLWVPPLLPGFSAEIAKVILGLGIILAIPGILNSVKEAIKARPALPVGLGTIMGTAAPATGGALQLFHFWQQHEVTKALRGQAQGATGAPQQK